MLAQEEKNSLGFRHHRRTPRLPRMSHYQIVKRSYTVGCHCLCDIANWWRVQSKQQWTEHTALWHTRCAASGCRWLCTYRDCRWYHMVPHMVVTKDHSQLSMLPTG